MDIVSFLLEHGADIHAQGHDKTTPLLDAVYGGHYEVCCVCHTGFPMAAIFECVGLNCWSVGSLIHTVHLVLAFDHIQLMTAITAETFCAIDCFLLCYHCKVSARCVKLMVVGCRVPLTSAGPSLPYCSSPLPHSSRMDNFVTLCDFSVCVVSDLVCM